MKRTSASREFAFLVNDVARLLKTCADHVARPHGMTRAQWSVMARLERFEGLKQSERADMLDLQPITVTRLIDRLCDSGLIERRADPHDRRAKRLFLTPAARPMLDTLWALGGELLPQVLEGVDDAALARTVAELGTIRDNLRAIIDQRTSAQPERHPIHA